MKIILLPLNNFICGLILRNMCMSYNNFVCIVQTNMLQVTLLQGSY